MKKVLFFIVFLFTVAFAQAQDQIHTTSGRVIECKVTEVGTDEIKYKISKEADAAIFTIKKMDVVKIVFADGTVEKFKEEIDDPEVYANQNKTAIKMEFLSPLYGFTAFSLERSIRPGMSWEGTLGLIGLGRDLQEIKPRGANVKFGFRFLKTPDFKTGNLRYWHLLKGGYIQPQIIAGAYEHNVNYYDYTGLTGRAYTSREVTSYVALNLVLGKQNVYNNLFLIDLYGGIGYGYLQTTNKTNTNQTTMFESRNGFQQYGMMAFDNDFPITLSLGLKIGILTK